MYWGARRRSTTNDDQKTKNDSIVNTSRRKGKLTDMFNIKVHKNQRRKRRKAEEKIPEPVTLRRADSRGLMPSMSEEGEWSEKSYGWTLSKFITRSLIKGQHITSSFGLLRTAKSLVF